MLLQRTPTFKSGYASPQKASHQRKELRKLRWPTLIRYEALRERRETYSRSTRSIRDCHPSPVALKYAKTSGL